MADTCPLEVGWRVCGVGHGVLELATSEGGGVREPAYRVVPCFCRGYSVEGWVDHDMVADGAQFLSDGARGGHGSCGFW